jgi:hypothetical protein
MGQISGSVQDIEIDFTGAASTWKVLVCLKSSGVQTSSSVAEEETNCGVLTSVSVPKFIFSFDAICEVAPSGSQASYEDCLAAIVGSDEVSVRFQNPTVTGSSVGTFYYHKAQAYFTDLNLTQDAAAGGYVSFSGTLQSTGTLDITA